MRITSYNVTDVAYHYIGLRALGGLPETARRDEQTGAIARSVRKYVNDRALRLMLPEPRGTFETVGEKVCQELVHFRFARFVRARGAYELTETGRGALALLQGHRSVELRRLMVSVHLSTYDNLRAVVQRHLEVGSIWRAIVETGRSSSEDYVRRLLEPTFGEEAVTVAASVLEGVRGKGPKAVEDALNERVLDRIMGDANLSVPLFRALTDRLTSLRLLNVMRIEVQGCEFAKSYTPCVADAPPRSWYVRLDVPLSSGGTYCLYLCELNVDDPETQDILLAAIEEGFLSLSPQGGYYDLPDLRDFVCERLRIPESAFDEGVNRLLDLEPSPLTTGLRYEGISSRRRPLVRGRETTQVYNLIRRA